MKFKRFAFLSLLLFSAVLAFKSVGYSGKSPGEDKPSIVEITSHENDFADIKNEAENSWAPCLAVSRTNDSRLSHGAIENEEAIVTPCKYAWRRARDGLSQDKYQETLNKNTIRAGTGDCYPIFDYSANSPRNPRDAIRQITISQTA